jgi:hypothetical protein
VPFNGYDRGEHFKGHFHDDLTHFSGFDELQTLQLFVLACALVKDIRWERFAMFESSLKFLYCCTTNQLSGSKKAK